MRRIRNRLVAAKPSSSSEPVTPTELALVLMSETTTGDTATVYSSPLSALTRAWIGAAIGLWAVGLALTTTPPLTDAKTLAWTAVAAVVLPLAPSVVASLVVAPSLVLSPPESPQPTANARAVRPVTMPARAEENRLRVLMFMVF